MRKHRKTTSRLLAALLSVSVILQSTPVIALADERVESNVLGSSDTTFTVSFVLSEGSAAGQGEVAVLFVNSGSKVGGQMPSDPAPAEGYRFVGWFAGDTPFDGGTVINGDTTVTARFEQTDITPSEENPESGEESPDNDGGQEPGTEENQATEEETAAAAEKYFTVVFYNASGEKELARAQYAGDGSEQIGALPARPHQAGYRFAGWVDQNGNEVKNGTPVTGDLSVRPQFEEIKVYEVTVEYYYVNSLGEDVVFHKVIHDVEMSDLPMTLESPGWTEGSDAEGRNQFYPTQQSITITPEDLTEGKILRRVEYVRASASYQFAYYLKDLSGDGYSLIEQPVTVYGVMGSTVTPTIKTFDFADYQKTETVLIDRDNLEIPVYYTRKQFTLSYETGEGSYIEAVNAPYETQITLSSSNPVRDGYAFGGWYLDEDCTQAAPSVISLKSNMRIYAKWIPQKVNYTVVYMIENADDDGYSYLTSSVKSALVGETVTQTAKATGLPSALDTKNFTFEEASSVTVKPDGSSVVTVKYKRNVYTVTWNGKYYYANSRGTLTQTTVPGSATLSAKYGSSITAAWIRTFNTPYPDYAWNFTKVNNDKFVSIDTMPSGNKEVYAFYFATEKKQTLSYWLENYEGEQTRQHNGRTYGQYKTITVRFNYLYDGADFYDILGYTKADYEGFYETTQSSGWGWNASTQTVTKEYTLGSATPNGALDVDFYYNANQYSLAFYDSRGALIQNEMVTLNADISGYLSDESIRPEPPVPGAEWVGWCTDYNRTQLYAGSGKMPTGLALYASWRLPVFTVRFDNGNGNAGAGEDTYYYGEEAVSRNAGSRDGYIFRGWYKDKDCTQPYDFGAPVTSDITVYAKWTPVTLTYRIRYVDALTGENLMDERIVTNPDLSAGDVVSEQAAAIMGYLPDHSRASLTLTGNEAANIITFRYMRKEPYNTYKVRYVLASDPDTEISPSKIRVVSGDTISVKETAEEAEEGYYPEHEVMELTLTSDPEDNVITFLYNPYETRHLKVRYVDMDGNALAAMPEREETLPVGSSFIVPREAPSGYRYYSITDDQGHTGRINYLMQEKDISVTVSYQKILRVSALPLSKVYDGTPLFSSEISHAEYEGLRDGDRVSMITFSGSRTDAGTSETLPVDVKIDGPASSAYYAVSCYGSTLRVDPLEVTVSIEGDNTKAVYDGAAHEAAWHVRQISNALFKESYISFNGDEPVVSRVHAGKYLLSLQGMFSTKEEYQNNFRVTYEATDGLVEIERAGITVTTGSASKVYDGEPLTNDEWSIEGLASGEQVLVNMTGSRTDAGSSENTYEIIWADSDRSEAGGGVAAVAPTARQTDYEIIRSQCGTLQVDQAEGQVVLRGEKRSLRYDGKTHNIYGYEVVSAPEGYTEKDFAFTKDAAAVGKDAGTYAMGLASSDFVNLNGNYRFVQFVIEQDGVLEIKPRRLTIRSGSAEKEYDGTPLRNEDVTVTSPDAAQGEGFAAGEGATYTFTGSQTVAGSSENLFTFALDPQTKEENYDITLRCGLLNVVNRETRYEITAEGMSGEYVYDGTQKSVSGLAQDTFVIEGNTYTLSGLSAEAAATDAGAYESAVTGTAVVRDSAGRDVTEQFSVSVIPGTLTIRRRNVMLESASASREYDGEPLRAGEVTVSGDGFVSGEGVTFDVTGSRVLPGNSENTFSYRFADGTNPDNYNIQTVRGVLKILDRSEKYALTLQAASAAYEYDGTEKHVSGFLTTKAVVGGKTYTVVGLDAEASAVDAGLIETEVSGSAQVLDKNGNDVSSQFTVSVLPGTLEISRRKVVLTSASASKEYDGTPLRAEHVRACGPRGEANPFAPGEGFRAEVTGSQLLEGSSRNTFTYTLNEGTKERNYEITVETGLLQVTSRSVPYAVTVTAQSGRFVYDGSRHAVSGLTQNSFIINGCSYTVEGLTAEGSGTDAGAYPVTVSGSPLVRDVRGNDVTKQFDVTTEEGQLTIAKRAIVFESNSLEKEYDGDALTGDSVLVYPAGGSGEAGEESGAFAPGEGADFTYTGYQILPGTSDNTFTYAFKDGTNGDNYAVTVLYGSLTVIGRSARYDLTVRGRSGSFMYDGQEKMISGLEETTFVVEGNTYTVEGMSAAGFGTDAGSWPVNVIGHPRVLDENGNDVTDQFAVRAESGILTIRPRELMLESLSAEKEYDGYPLQKEEVTVGGDGFAEGESFTFRFGGGQTLPGTGANTFSCLAGAGTKEENYRIHEQYGTLTVLNRTTPFELTVEAANGTFLYDGESHSVSGLRQTVFTLGSAAFSVEGLTASGQGVHAGTYPVTVSGSARVLDEAGNDVSAQFTVSRADGVLTIAPRNVTLRSLSAEKEYDGMALVNPLTQIAGDGFAEGEGADITVTGQQRLPGSSRNTFDYELHAGTDAQDYHIVKEEGALHVTDRTDPFVITAEAIDGSLLYDGSVKTLSDLTDTDGLAEHEFEIDGSRYLLGGLTASVTGQDAGEYEIVLTGRASVTDAYGADVSDQFRVDIKRGTLTIEKRTVNLESAGAEKEYDGTPLTNDTVSVSGDGFAPGEEFLFHVTGSRLTVGSSENTFTYVPGSMVKPENYEIQTNYGILTVLSRQAPFSVTVTPQEGDYLYDGSEKTVEQLRETVFEVNGKQYTVEGLNVFCAATDAGEYPVTITGTPSVRDENGNDVTTQFAVHAEPGTLRIRPRELVFTSGSAQKEYDGAVLTEPTVEITGDGFAPGEGAEFSVSGNRRIPGISDNTFSYQMDAQTDPANYVVTTVEGKLRIDDRTVPYELTVNAQSGSFRYDGTEKQISGYETVFNAGDADSYEVRGLSVFAQGTDAGEYEAAVMGTPVILDSEGNDVTGQFSITANSGLLEILRRSVTLVSGSARKEYDGRALTNAAVVAEGDGFAAGEGFEAVTDGAQTIPGESRNSFTYTLSEGTKEENYIIDIREGLLRVTDRQQPYEIALHGQSLSETYDGTEKTAEGFAEERDGEVPFTLNGLTFRVEGLSTGVSGTGAGSYTGAVEGTAAVYDAEGHDVTGQFTVTADPAQLRIAKRTVTLTSGSAAKEYDGSELREETVETGGDGFAPAEGAVYSGFAGRQVPGISENTFAYTLNPGTLEDNYIITAMYGTLNVTNREAPYEITARAQSFETLYDGENHSALEMARAENPEETGLIETRFEIEGHSYLLRGLRIEGTGRNAGTYPVTVTGTPDVRDENGRDVTEQFSVLTEDGTLEIRPRTVILTSDTLQKEYDGSPLTAPNVEVSGDGFAPGEGAQIEVTGSRTLPGTSANTFVYRLEEGTEESNYRILTRTGALLVTDRTDPYVLTVISQSGSYVYDGSEKSVEGFVRTGFEIDGNYYEVNGLSAHAQGRNAGSYVTGVTGSPRVTDATGSDVTSQFSIRILEGTLQIRQRQLSLTTPSDSREYNGTPLKAGTVIEGGDGFVAGEGAVYEVTGEQTLPGTSENLFTYAFMPGTRAENYLVSTQPGTLTVTPRQEPIGITLSGVGGEALYDGHAHRIEGFETTGVTVGGHTFTVKGLETAAEGTDAGAYTASVTGKAIVLDENGNDVSDQFAVSVTPGTLVVRRRNVRLVSGSAEKEYDGSALVNEEVVTEGDGFAENEEPQIEVTGTQTLPGSSVNSFTYSLPVNVKAENYQIVTQEGMLTVTNRSTPFEITVRAQSGEVFYDGSEKTTADLPEGENGGVLFGTVVTLGGRTFRVSGLQPSVSGTDAGTYPVTVEGEPVITDEAGDDVTAQFTVHRQEGSLTILPREVTLTSGSAEKEYDGSALTESSVEVSGDGFAQGEGAAFTVTGSQKIPGTSGNTFSYRLNGNTLAENYTIETVFGELTVTDRTVPYELTVNGRSASFTYDADEKQVEGFDTVFPAGDKESFEVRGLTANTSGTDAGEYEVAVTGTPSVLDSDGSDVTGQFNITVNSGLLEILPRSLVLTSASAEKEYDGTALTAENVEVTGDGFAAGEGAAFTVTGRQLTPGSSSNSFTFELEEGTKAENYSIRTLEGRLLVTDRSAPYELTVVPRSGDYLYDGTEKSVEGFAQTSFEIDGNEYEVSGLNAYASGRDAGTYTVGISGSVRVTDAAGSDVTDQFTVRTLEGFLRIRPREVVLTSASDEREYDGTALRNDTVTEAGDGFAPGEGAAYAVTGEQTIPGSSENTFTYALAPGTRADNYLVQTQPGTLTVTSREVPIGITLGGNSGEALYDGNPHSIEGFETTTVTVNGHTFTITGVESRAEGTDAGSYTAQVTGSPALTDENGNDVTDQFELSVTPGVLEIRPRTVTLTSGSKAKEYDGSVLTEASVAVTGDGFAPGEGAFFTVTGSQKIPGTSENTFSYRLNENTLADNYRVETVFGELTVTDRTVPYELTVNGHSASFTYDGTEKQVEGFDTVFPSGLSDSCEVRGLTAGAAGTDAGVYENRVSGTASVLDSDGNDVTGQFNIRVNHGQLEILKRSVVLTSASGEKEYDGTPLESPLVTAQGEGFAEGEGFEAVTDGSQLIPGESSNSFTYTLTEGTKEENYSIETSEGLLRVTDRQQPYEITLHGRSLSELYDGSLKEVRGFEEDSEEGTIVTAGGLTFRVEGLSAGVSGTNAGTYAGESEGTATVIDAEGNDVTGQFSVEVIPGELKIARRTVILTSGSVTGEYDGNGLREETVTVGGDGFAPGEGAEYSFTGSREVPGISANTFTYTLEEGTLEDNYEITVSYGTLNVTNREAPYEITARAESFELLYDGESHSALELAALNGLDESGLRETAFEVGGHSYLLHGLQIEGTGRNAGTYAVTVTGTPVVLDENGEDVTDQFAVQTEEGTLTILQRTVELTSESLEKEYDGTALSGDAVEVTGDGFAAGEGAVFEVSGRALLPGSSPNSFVYRLEEGTEESNYRITTHEGTLLITDRTVPYELTLVPQSGEYLYDGTEKSVEGFTQTSFEAEGNRYEVSGLSAYAHGRDAGTYAVGISGSARVTDAMGNDVTEQFTVNTEEGMLTILPREVTLTSASAEREYDGAPLTDETVTAAGDGFAAGEGALYTVTGVQTVPGSSENTFTYTFAQGTSADNYVVEIRPGTLTVTSREVPIGITLDGNSGEALYDGNPHSIEGFETTTVTVNGHTFTITGMDTSSEGTDAGTYTAQMTGSPVVLDENGNDVTDQFDVSVTPGVLEVRQRSVLLTSGSAEKEYDGSVLTESSVEVSGDGFAQGEGAAFTVTGSQKIPGSSGNTFSYRLNGNTLAENYTIETVFGELTVTDRTVPYELTVNGRSASFTYDADEKQVEGFDTVFPAGDKDSFEVRGLTAIAAGTDAGEYEVAVTGTPLVLDSDGSDVTGQFNITVNSGLLEILPRSLVLTSASDEKEYDGTALTAENVEVSGDGFAPGEGAAFTVTGRQLTPGSSSNSFTFELEEGTKAENYSIRTLEGRLLVTDRSAPYELTVVPRSGDYLYDGSEKSVEGFEQTSFEVDGNVYEVSGLNAYASGRDAGVYSVAVTGSARVTDAAGSDVTDQFTVRTQEAELRIRQREVVLTSASDEREYDGTPLMAGTVTESGDGFAPGEGAAYEVTGEQTIPGSSENTFTYAFAPGTRAENYLVETQPGTLTVTPREERIGITVNGAGGEAVYDGEPHSVEGFETTTVTVGGHTFTITGVESGAEGTDAGSYTAEVTGSPALTDENGNDVTDQFDLSIIPGILDIRPRSILLTSASAEKEYDGLPLLSGEVTAEGDGFVENEEPEITVTGSQTLVGSSKNTFTYTLPENVKAENYRIRTQEGVLTVTNRSTPFEITVRAQSGEVLYDGGEKTAADLPRGENADALIGTVVTRSGQTYKVSGLSAKVSGTDAGTYSVIVEGTPSVIDAAGHDVTAQFAVHMRAGTLTILPREVTLASGSAQKEYDGTALENDEVTIGGDGFVAGEEPEIEVTGSVLTPGSAANAFDYHFAPQVNRENYRIVTEEGTLTVTDRSEPYDVSVQLASASFLYDGKEKTAQDLPGSILPQAELNVDGNRYTVEGIYGEGSGQDAGTYPIRAAGTPVIRDAYGNDVTAQFNLQVGDGELTITPRTLIVSSGSAQKEYDGTALVSEETVISGDGFAEGESCEATAIGSRVLPGTAQNTIYVRFAEGTRSGNYTVVTQPGTLTVLDRTVPYEAYVKAADLEVKYDGRTQSVSGFADAAAGRAQQTGSLTISAGGHLYTVEGLEASVSGVDAGTYENAVTGEAAVLDENGNDVTGQFRVSVENGSLTILPRTVLVTSANAVKEYDGLPLVSDRVVYGGDGFVGEDGLEVSVAGTQLLPGVSENTFTWTFAEGTNPENYQVSATTGQLRVTDRMVPVTVTLRAPEAEAVYDGTEHTLTGFYIASDETPETFVENEDGSVSFTSGGQTYYVEGVTATVSGRDAGTYPAQISQQALIRDENGNDVTDQFRFSIIPGSLTILPRQVSVSTYSAEKEYDGSELADSRILIGGDGFAEGEGLDADVTGSQTLPGSSENQFTYTLREGTLEQNYVIATEFGTLTVVNRDARFEILAEAVSGSVLYDGTEKTIADLITEDCDPSGLMETEFTVEGSTYRLEGMRAGVSAVDAGSYPVAVTGTPRVIDADGNDVTEQFAVRTAAGRLTIERRTLTLSSGSAGKEYDGTALTQDAVTIEGDGLAGSDDLTIVSDGSQLLPGESSNTFHVVWASGTNPDNYSLTTSFGTLTVSGRAQPYEITVKSTDTTAVYDGAQHTSGGLETSVFTVDGNTYTVTGLDASVSGEHAGSYENVITGQPRIIDMYGNDVTDQFNVSLESGTLEILPRNLTFTSASDEKEYDGRVLRNDTVTVSGDGFVTGEGAVFNVTGEALVPGTAANTFTFTMSEGTNPQDYNVTTVEGTLTILPRQTPIEITVKASDAEAVYDGSTKVVSGFETLTWDAGGFTVTVEGLSAGVSGLDAGTYRSEVTGIPVVRDSYGNDITSQFALRIEPGTLVIRKRSILLRSASAEKVYDGHALRETTVAAEGDDGTFAPGEGVIINVFGSRILPGSSLNEFTWQPEYGTNPDNYDIRTQFGTLTVLSRDARYEITAQALDERTVYDGTLQRAGGEEAENGFLSELVFTENGKDYTLEGLYAQAEATDAGEYPVEVLGTPYVYDEDGNDVTDQFAVHTQSGLMTIEERPVSLTSASSEKVYDGEALTDDRIDEGEMGFAPGEGAEYHVTGSQTLVGESENTFSYRLSEGTDSRNYTFTPVFGSLVVTGDNLQSEKEIEGGRRYRIGDTVTSRIRVRNVSDATAENVTVSDPQADIIDGSGYTVSGGNAVLTLAPGQETVVYARHTVTPADVTAGRYENTASVTFEGNETSASAVLTDLDDTVSLIVRYQTDGPDTVETFETRYPYGSSYQVTSPPLPGYRPESEAVTGILTEDTVIEVFYRRLVSTLRIRYLYTDGSQAAPDYQITYPFGSEYAVASPVIDGYETAVKTVSGVMDSGDVQVTVFYVKTEEAVTRHLQTLRPDLTSREIREGAAQQSSAYLRQTLSGDYGTMIDDYGTPLGLGSLNRNAGEGID